MADDKRLIRCPVYAQTYWPTGHRRHLDAADRFGRYLRDIDNPSLCRWEWHRHAFLFVGARFQVQRWREWRGGRCRRLALQVLWRGLGHARPRDAFLALNLGAPSGLA